MYCEHLLKYKQDFTHSEKISPKLDAILNSETTEQIQKHMEENQILLRE